MSERRCSICKALEGKKECELRPYGADGALICFKCGTSPKHEKETRKQFDEKLALAGRIAIATNEGPARLETRSRKNKNN